MDKNGAGMKRDGQDWCPNETEWTRMVPECTGTTPEYTEMSLNETAINTNMVSPT